MYIMLISDGFEDILDYSLDMKPGLFSMDADRVFLNMNHTEVHDRFCAVIRCAKIQHIVLPDFMPVYQVCQATLRIYLYLSTEI